MSDIDSQASNDGFPWFTGKHVLVVGIAVRGRSAIAVARLLTRRGARVTVTDPKSHEELKDDIAAMPFGVSHELGGFRKESFATADLIVLAHEVACRPELAAAKQAGVPVINHVELGARFLAAEMVAITGTNGKSTTTTILHEIMQLSRRPLFVGGSLEGWGEGRRFLGLPLVEAAFTPAAASAVGIAVVEVSSYQLEFTEEFHPKVGILLNISPDHLGRHGGIDGYAAAKARIFANQAGDDFAVFNLDDPRVAAIGEQARAVRLPVSLSRTLDQGGWLERGESGLPGTLCLRLPGLGTERYSAELPGIHGRHNQANALAAALAARALGSPPAEVEAGLRAYRPLPHRMNLVGQRNGVAFFDDSQAKNIGAVVAGLLGFDRKVVLIAGGREKASRSYEPLVEPMKAVGRAAVVIGEAAGRIARTLVDTVPVARATSVENAVALAVVLAKPGDAVVFSPGCPGTDMFSSRGERGDAFCAAMIKACEQDPAG